MLDFHFSLHIHYFAECQLNITIQIGDLVAPKQYIAASGPFTFICNVQGATEEPLTYRWSSTCLGCPFSTAKSVSVYRAALRSTDSGIHTCNVIEENTGRCGNGSFQMTIVGRYPLGYAWCFKLLYTSHTAVVICYILLCLDG